MHSASFFFYAALILFVVFGIVPNFLPVPDAVFRMCLVALILLLDRLLHRRFKMYSEQGTVEFDDSELRLRGRSGMVEHKLAYNDIYKIFVIDGVPVSLFGFFSEYRTQVAEIVFRDGRTMQFECVRKAIQAPAETDLDKWIDVIKPKFGEKDRYFS